MDVLNDGLVHDVKNNKRAFPISVTVTTFRKFQIATVKFSHPKKNFTEKKKT